MCDALHRTDHRAVRIVGCFMVRGGDVSRRFVLLEKTGGSDYYYSTTVLRYSSKS
jgi:hypothetical protein